MKKINKILNQFPFSKIIEIEKLIFSDVDGKDVYNISKTFVIDGKEFLFGRVEPRDNSELSKVFLFKKVNNIWIPENKFIPLENSEDPFISRINGDFVLGCVEVIRMDNKSHEFDPENK
ncbi:MAG: DUF1861 family protein, partial [Bacteroidales bacterium]|nr:DUF1861 family protein [Bacteroidales bacterium]